MTMKMSPVKVLEAQAELSTRLRTSPIFQRFIAGSLTRQIREGSPLSDNMLADQVAISFDHLVNGVRAAEAYHVNSDMTQVIQAAAAGLDNTDVFDFELAPSHSGIVRFDDGLRIVDVRGRDLIIDWIVWTTGAFQTMAPEPVFGRLGKPGDIGMGAAWFEFNDAIDNPDTVTHMVPNGHKVYGRWGFSSMNIATNGQRVGPVALNAPVGMATRILLEGDYVVPASNTVRLLHAFWLILQQQITVTSTTRAHPNMRAGLKKARLPKDAKVTVVELRKHRYITDSEGAARQVEWDHRWLVRGFWRWQACGPGRTQRKRIWINDFVKGPEGKPLVIKNRVMDLRR